MYIGIDLGGSHLRIASFASLDNPSPENITRLKTTGSYTGDKENIIQTIKHLTQEVHGIGMGLAGPLNTEKTFVKRFTNMSDWNEKPIKQDLENEFHCPVYLENDATAAALGEALYGYGKGKNFLFLIWGTGIGGTFVSQVNGRPILTSSELGHQCIVMNGNECACTQLGCLEAYCGGKSMTKAFGHPSEEMSDGEWEPIEKMMAQGVRNCIVIHPVETVICSGGVALNNGSRLKNIERNLNEIIRIVRAPIIQLSQYKDNIGLYGAVSLLKYYQ